MIINFKWAARGIEPRTTRTQSEYHTTRPRGQRVGHAGIRTRVSAFKVLRAKPLHYTALTHKIQKHIKHTTLPLVGVEPTIFRLEAGRLVHLATEVKYPLSFLMHKIHKLIFDAFILWTILVNH